jgi:hypothetical protein
MAPTPTSLARADTRISATPSAIATPPPACGSAEARAAWLAFIPQNGYTNYGTFCACSATPVGTAGTPAPLTCADSHGYTRYATSFCWGWANGGTDGGASANVFTFMSSSLALGCNTDAY